MTKAELKQESDILWKEFKDNVKENTDKLLFEMNPEMSHLAESNLALSQITLDLAEKLQTLIDMHCDKSKY